MLDSPYRDVYCMQHSGMQHSVMHLSIVYPTIPPGLCVENTGGHDSVFERKECPIGLGIWSQILSNPHSLSPLSGARFRRGIDHPTCLCVGVGVFDHLLG